MHTVFIYSLLITPQFHTKRHAQENRGNLVTARKSKMAAVEESSMCGSCFSVTKYTCLKCGKFFCMRCSVFDEETPGWKAGRSVARCEGCVRDKMSNERDEIEFDRENDTNISNTPSSFAFHSLLFILSFARQRKK